MAKLGGIVWLGRAAVALFVGSVLLNVLSANPRFENDPIARYGLSAFATVMCIFMLYILTKGS
jgi:hypothetical protein